MITRKLAQRATAQEARDRVETYVHSWRVIGVTSTIVLEAARGASEHSFPDYDAQIWATARVHRIPLIVTEDFSHASRIEGVEFVNPFLAALPGEE